MKYRKKPVVVEAFQWFATGMHPAVKLFGGTEPAPPGQCRGCGTTGRPHGWIETLEGGHIVCPGDYIIRGIKGELYPCKPDIFAATYEATDEAD